MTNSAELPATDGKSEKNSSSIEKLPLLRVRFRYVAEEKGGGGQVCEGSVGCRHTRQDNEGKGDIELHRRARTQGRRTGSRVEGRALLPGDRILSKMGEGTFGQVLECLDNEKKEIVAIKIVRSLNTQVSRSCFY